MGANFFRTVDMIISNLGATPLVCTLPIGSEDNFQVQHLQGLGWQRMAGFEARRRGDAERRGAAATWTLPGGCTHPGCRLCMHVRQNQQGHHLERRAAGLARSTVLNPGVAVHPVNV